MAIYLQAHCTEDSQGQDFWQVMKFIQLRSTCTSIVLNMGYKNYLIHLKEYVLCVWHTIILWQSLLQWLTAGDEIRVLAFNIHLICSEYRFKYNLLQIKKIVCFAWITVSLYWTWAGIM